jgi:hypothetical protein
MGNPKLWKCRSSFLEVMLREFAKVPLHSLSGCVLNTDIGISIRHRWLTIVCTSPSSLLGECRVLTLSSWFANLSISALVHSLSEFDMTQPSLLFSKAILAGLSAITIVIRGKPDQITCPFSQMLPQTSKIRMTPSRTPPFSPEVSPETRSEPTC